jgi:hypothetical protein
MVTGPAHALCRALADDALPSDLTPAQLDAIWDHATRTSVDELLAALVCRTDAPVSDVARQRAVQRMREASARELVRHHELRQIVAAFAAASLRVLLIKGAGLAYTVYPDPRLRPSDDVDVLVERQDVAATEAALFAVGYERCVEPDAELASTQRHYARSGGAVEHSVDLHWRVSNRHVFADVVGFEEAWNESVDVPSLGPAARTLGTADALLLACVHRVAHHPGETDLIWLWDIHLLAGRLTGVQAETLLRRAAEKGMRAVLAHSLSVAASRFGTRGADVLLDRLAAGGAAEPSAAFIAARARQVDLLRTDLAAVGSARQRLRLLREHLFPGVAYMRAKYPAWPGPLLPLAYLYRIVRGAPKWFARP